MAAVTVTTPTTDTALNPLVTLNPVLNPRATAGSKTVRLNNCKHGRWAVGIAADQDTWATGITTIVDVAWQGTQGTDLGLVSFDTTGTITFTTNGAANGYVHIWWI